MTRRTANAFRVAVIELLVLTDIGFVQAQKFHGVLHTQFLRGRDAVRILFRISDFLTRQILPSDVVTVGVPAFGTDAFRSHDLAPVEELILRVMTAILNGTFDLLGFNNPVLLVL